MNEFEFAKMLRTNYDLEIKHNNDFLNLVGDIKEYQELDYNKIKSESEKLGITFMSSSEALKLCKTQQGKNTYNKEPNKYIFFDKNDEDKGIE